MDLNDNSTLQGNVKGRNFYLYPPYNVGERKKSIFVLGHIPLMNNSIDQMWQCEVAVS